MRIRNTNAGTKEGMQPASRVGRENRDNCNKVAVTDCRARASASPRKATEGFGERNELRGVSSTLVCESAIQVGVHDNIAIIEESVNVATKR